MPRLTFGRWLIRAALGIAAIATVYFGTLATPSPSARASGLVLPLLNAVCDDGFANRVGIKNRMNNGEYDLLPNSWTTAHVDRAKIIPFTAQEIVDGTSISGIRVAYEFSPGSGPCNDGGTVRFTTIKSAVTDLLSNNSAKQSSVFTFLVYEDGFGYKSLIWMDCGNFSEQGPTALGSISGRKFEDRNANRSSSGDPGLAGWRINLSGPVNASTTTSGSGNYSFNNLPAGSYTVSETSQSGWFQSAPASGSYNVTIPTSGGNVDNKDFGNFRKGAVTGQKFDDLDGDGTKDAGELGIQGWQILLNGTDGMGTPVSRSTNTGATGNYSFGNLNPGSYKITEASEPKTPGPGDQWVQSFPPSSQYSVTPRSGQTIGGRDFGNYELGSISGTKFHDINGDGVEDVGDVGLEGWKINLTGTAGDGATVNRSTMTDANGDYIFDKLPPGNYKVSEIIPDASWIQTKPNPKAGTNNHSLTLQSGEDIADIDFGNAMLGSIHGTKYQDVAGDGARDIGDIGLEGWKINLDGTTGLGNAVSLSTVTNANGEYWFMDLPPGQYTISEKLLPLWVQTVPPPPGTYKVTLTSGEVVIDRDFGNFASFGKSPQHANLFLTRQGAKIPPSSCLEGTDSATVAVVIAPIPDTPDPKDPTQNQELGAFEFEVAYNAKDVCLEIAPATAASDMICTIEDDVTKPTLEGVARIGCVTLGKNFFPDTATLEGRHLADIIVRPQPEIYSLAKPNQDNGVVAELKNTNCDFSDLQGHPIPSIKCANSSVTMRYLEGDVEPDCVIDAIDAQALAFRWGVEKGSVIYREFMNLEPSGTQADNDIDINDLQFVYGRFGSTCDDPHPLQPPVNPTA